MTKNVPDSTVLSILKTLPLEDRVWMIEKPHLRILVEENLTNELNSGTARREICRKARRIIKHLRTHELISH